MSSNRGQDEADTSTVVEDGPEWIVLGRISGLFGVRGWVKVFSHTSPRANILDYRSWHLQRAGSWEAYRLQEGKVHGKGVIARLEDCGDRGQAAELVGADIAIRRDQLPKAGPGEFYWSDLEKLKVKTLVGQDFGTVHHLLKTGANDVLVVQGDRQRLIPFIADVVIEVDLEAGVIRVDWDPDF